MPVDEQPPVAPPPPAPSDRPRYRQLTGRERAGAIVAGIVIGTVGFVAMFITKNEGGVAVAILLAGVLLVLGIQGTQLVKLGGKDIGAEMALREEERREIAQAAKAIAVEDPARAEAMLEGYQVADPGARYSAPVAEARDVVFEQALLLGLRELFPEKVFGLPDVHIGQSVPYHFVAMIRVDDVDRIGVLISRRPPRAYGDLYSRSRDRILDRDDAAAFVRQVVSKFGLTGILALGPHPEAFSPLLDAIQLPAQTLNWQDPFDNGKFLRGVGLLRQKIAAERRRSKSGD